MEDPKPFPTKTVVAVGAGLVMLAFGLYFADHETKSTALGILMAAIGTLATAFAKRNK